MRTWTRMGAGVLTLALALGVAACGDDSDDDDASTVEEDSDESTTTTEAAGTGETITVTAVDYAFEGLPSDLAVGDKLALVNQSAGEIHELVAFRLPDGEERTASELLALPEEEAEALLGGGPPTMVLLSPPSSTETIPAVGDGTVSEPGRYLVICSIPTGADPQAFLDAAAADSEEAPDVEGGPPHFTQGMFAEVNVS